MVSTLVFLVFFGEIIFFHTSAVTRSDLMIVAKSRLLSWGILDMTYCLYPSEFSIGFPWRARLLKFGRDANFSTSESFETLLAWKYSTLRLENSSKA